MKGRILIADEHDLLRRGVAAFLAHQWEVVGQASDGKEAVALVKEHRPDIVVMDWAMHGLSGVDATSQIRTGAPSTRVILLTQQLSREAIGASFRAGASAYVAKQAVAQELMTALEAVLEGKFYVTASAQLPELRRVAGRPIQENPAVLLAPLLTPRQVDVLRLISSGKSSKEAAAILGISVKTVEFHRNGIADQLGIRTTADLTRYAISSGILQDV